MKKMDKAIARKERHLKRLEQMIERENNISEEFCKRTEKKYTDARELFEKERKFKQEKNAMIEELSDKIRTKKSELAKIEEILHNYKRYKTILSKLSPLEWQEAQEAKALKAEVLSDREAQDEQHREPQGSAVRQGVERGLESSPGRVLPSTEEPALSPSHDNTMVTNVKLGCNRSEHEEKLVLYFSDSQQLQGVVEELTEQNLSLVQNSTKVDEILEELRQTVDINLKKMKEEEENLMLQANDMRDRNDQERKRVVQLTKKVQLHDSLRTADQDIMLDALGVKVTEVHCCCVNSRLTSLSTLEKLASIEYHMSLLFQHIENIPEESLEKLRQIKDSERRNRLREEKLRLQREKQEKRMEKCVQRSLSDAKKIKGRKLMPRCIPVNQKASVYSMDDLPAEDEFHAYLFTTEDVEKNILY